MRPAFDPTWGGTYRAAETMARGTAVSRTATRARRGYHHGDLRNAVIDEAVRVVREGGVSTLSIRDVARRIGVSHNAPYAHFPNSGDLLVAVAVRGLHELADRLRQALEAPQWLKVNKLEALCIAYVMFADEEAGLFRAIFQVPMLATREGGEIAEATERVLAVVTSAVAEAQSEGVIVADDPREIALVAWTMIHGLGTLIAERRLGPLTRAQIERRVKDSTRRLYFGLAPPELTGARRKLGFAFYDVRPELRGEADPPPIASSVRSRSRKRT